MMLIFGLNIQMKIMKKQVFFRAIKYDGKLIGTISVKQKEDGNVAE